MYHVVVATRNPAKLSAVTDAFEKVLGHGSIQITGIAADSGVAAQPMTERETWQGADNRLAAIRREIPAADYWLSIEAGVDKTQAFAWIIIENKTQRSEARSASFMLPPRILAQLNQGAELGPLMSQLTGIDNIKHKGGAIGAITSGHLTRASVYQQAIVLAISSLIHPLYSANID